MKLQGIPVDKTPDFARALGGAGQALQGVEAVRDQRQRRRLLEQDATRRERLAALGEEQIAQRWTEYRAEQKRQADEDARRERDRADMQAANVSALEVIKTLYGPQAAQAGPPAPPGMGALGPGQAGPPAPSPGALRAAGKSALPSEFMSLIDKSIARAATMEPAAGAKVVGAVMTFLDAGLNLSASRELAARIHDDIATGSLKEGTALGLDITGDNVPDDLDQIAEGWLQRLDAGESSAAISQERDQLHAAVAAQRTKMERRLITATQAEQRLMEGGLAIDAEDAGQARALIEAAKRGEYDGIAGERRFQQEFGDALSGKRSLKIKIGGVETTVSVPRAELPDIVKRALGDDREGPTPKEIAGSVGEVLGHFDPEKNVWEDYAQRANQLSQALYGKPLFDVAAGPGAASAGGAGGDATAAFVEAIRAGGTPNDPKVRELYKSLTPEQRRAAYEELQGGRQAAPARSPDVGQEYAEESRRLIDSTKPGATPSGDAEPAAPPTAPDEETSPLTTATQTAATVGTAVVPMAEELGRALERGLEPAKAADAIVRSWRSGKGLARRLKADAYEEIAKAVEAVRESSPDALKAAARGGLDVAERASRKTPAGRAVGAARQAGGAVVDAGKWLSEVVAELRGRAKRAK